MYSTALQPNADFSTGLTVWNDIAKQQFSDSIDLINSTYDNILEVIAEKMF